ncbi:uncharacterized protein [Branchiostoma lanceolatum]|uniref:HARBI1 protein n=1 Tax=Branchiostoma lanceolatum TaxID=7740 RepID=A0A8K0EU64_BRALA|nr:HARBI1 [Branchiostoma lanceolatum]
MAGEPPHILLAMFQMFFFTYLMRVLSNMRQGARLARRRRLRYREMLLGRRPARIPPAFLPAAIALARGGDPIHREIWQYVRVPATFWQKFVQGCLCDAEFYKRFRMTRSTFQMICDKLNPVLAMTDTRMRSAIPTCKRLAICIYWLASGDLMRSVADLFGVSEGSVCVIVHEVCDAINQVLWRDYISFPTGQRLKETIQGYKERWQFPQCAGAVDGSHIPIKAPSKDRTDFYNRKGFYSVILQGVVDHMSRFTDISVGMPGSVHDARVLRKSRIFRRAESGTLLPQEFAQDINGVAVPAVLLGDAAYPHLPWLMKPYPDNGALGRDRFKFNYRHSRARMTVECAFGLLKGRWRCLTKRLDVSLDNVPTIVGACCVLHNICEVHKDEDLEINFPAEQAERRPAAQRPGLPNEARDALTRLFNAEEN